MSCPVIPYTHAFGAQFEAADAQFPGKRFELSEVLALDGSDCKPVTLDGVIKGAQADASARTPPRRRASPNSQAKVAAASIWASVRRRRRRR